MLINFQQTLTDRPQLLLVNVNHPATKVEAVLLLFCLLLPFVRLSVYCWRRGLIISAALTCTVTADNFCRAMLCKVGLCCHAVSVCVCLSVCLFVTFMDSAKMSNRIVTIFSQSSSQTILFFYIIRYGNIPMGTTQQRR